MNRSRSSIFGPGVLGCLLLAFGAPAEDGTWPRLRGPNGEGISEANTVPLQWTTNDYNWRIKLPGPGHSSPVIWGSRLFVTCGKPATGNRMILCLDSATGRVLWQRDYPSRPFSQNSDNSYATATPAADGAGVVVTWTTPDEVTLLALDNDGHESWRRNLGKYVCIHGSGASPVILDDLVVLANDQEDPKALPPSVYSGPEAPRSAGTSFLIGVDRKTGQTRWQLDRFTSQAAYATPCVYQPAGGKPQIIVVSTHHGVTGVDAANGKIDWELDQVLRERVDPANQTTNRQSEPLFTERCVASPIVADGLVFACEGRGAAGVRAVAVRPGAREKNQPPGVVADRPDQAIHLAEGLFA